ncbi:uncharacterized protein LOC133521280 [Cydia pomonella]|uniref:uncharacterized protein LOC133521280 n=1 Tax=Cydia pomonella TaxID=82600 RepID=UPI002ADD4316|nr:uncharacterized protein LOC133521280 [Cydia pomonella]
MRKISVFKMADGFDKESPDVMESQILRESPPEFSVIVIKKEVLNFYDSEFESTTSSVQDRKPYLQEEIVPNTFEALSSEIPDNEVYQDELLNSNKIILGSKPNLVCDDEDHFENSAELFPENDAFFEKDSKLNTESIDVNYFEELVTSYEPKVELLDIQSYLHKSRRYCDTCGILFPELNAFEKHVRIFHKATDLNKRRIYKCTICDKKFVAPHVLRNHLSNIHKLNNGKILERPRYRRVLDKMMRLHRCTICAKNFIAPHLLRTHLINIHKMNYAGVPYKKKQNTKNNITKELDSQIVNHDITSEWSNTCFHCKKTFDTQKCLIEHLYDILQMKRKNTEIVPVLKSILFKCNKCDINFTSSQFAANHAEHMEMLINWKCTICNRIFKKEDALSHERQHSVSNNFLVYNLEDLDVTKILFKCSKCAVHFTESSFLYHFRDCDLEVSKSVHCKICNMSLDYNLKTSHEYEHTEPNYYTIIESDVISDNPVKMTANKYQAKDKLQELLKSFREVKVVLQKIDTNTPNKSSNLKWSSDESLSDLESSSHEQTRHMPQKLQKDNNASKFRSTTETTVRNEKKIDLHRRRNLTYYYCKTCKCFVSRIKRKIHLEARCKLFSKETCKRCCLTFTTASLMTHRSLHEERKDLTLKSFKFFNLYNGKPINPAMPEGCNTKRLVNSTTRLGRRNVTYHYCETCKCFLTKFNKATIFHKRKLCKKIAKATCKHCGLVFTSASIMTHIRLHEERKDLTVKNFKLFNLHNGQPIDAPVRAPEVISLQQPANIEVETNNGDMSMKKNVKYYLCETCKCSVTNFKKKFHLEARCKDLTTTTCKHCGLTFTKSSMKTHMRLHKERKGLTLKSFKFFNLYNGLRTSPPIREVVNLNRHVNTLSDLETNSCEQTSNKSQELQKENNEPGFNSTAEITVRNQKKVDSRRYRNLTYYYCETCKCFVSRLKRTVHLEARCKKISKQTCKRCGLRFTTASLMTHERLHEEKKDLSLNNFKFYNLYNGLPMNLPAPANAILNGTVNNAAMVKIKKRSAKNINNWKTRRNLTYYYCETCKCSVTKFRKDVHLEARCSKLTKTTCKLCGLMFTKQSMITHMRLHQEKTDLSLKNFKFFNLYNGHSMDTPVLEVVKTPMNNEAEVVNVKQPNDVFEAKDESVLRPMNDKDELDNINRPVNVEGKDIFFKPLIINEVEVENIKQLSKDQAQSGNVKPCINIIADVENIISHVNNEAMVLNTKCPSNIQAAVENIIGLVNNKAEVKSVKQTINIEAEVLNTKLPLNVQSDIENIKEVVNNDAESENLKPSIKIGTAVENLIIPIYNNTEIENFENSIISEDTNIKLPLNSKEPMSNKAQDDSINRDKDIEGENIVRAVNVGLKVPEIERPLTYDGDTDMSAKFNQKYYYCETCKCFVTQFRKNTHLKARCKNLAKMACNQCGLTFTNGSMGTHKRLHVEKEDLTLNNFKFFNLYNGQPMNPPIKEVNELKQSEDLEIVDISLYSHNEIEALHVKLPGNTQDWRTNLNMTLYYCETCECFVTKYKRAFHLQARCKNFAKVTCESCGLTITRNSILTHTRQHEERKDFTLNNFKLFNLHSGQPMNSYTLKVLNKKRNINVKAEVASIKPASREDEIINIKRSLNVKGKHPRRNLNYYFCETCKCFVTKFTKNAHLQARCKSFSKTTCKLCGLRFTKASMMTHKRLHKENKDLSVKNFQLFNLTNGQPIKASKFEVVNRNRFVDERNLSNYYCATCKCFETLIKKEGHIHESCINMARLPCKYCGLIFSNASFVIHKSLHEERRNLTLKNFKFFDLQNSQPMNPPLPEYPKCTSCAVHFLTITAKNSHICSDVSSLTCHICEIRFSEAAFKLHMAFHQYIADNTQIIESNNVQSAMSAININLNQNIDKHGTEKKKKNETNTSNHENHETELHNPLEIAEAPLRSPDSIENIVYTCRNCSVSVDTYDKAVEHSQSHYEPEKHETHIIVCNFCNLNIDEACYIEHQNAHEKGSQFKLLHFDSYYLPADNNLWIKHIFETFPGEKVIDILRNSIYRFECRIKMDVIQQGDPNLTVYKCDQCGCFIEPSALFKHSDNACFKLRYHPCTVCGIPFNSSASRIEHEKIHNRPDVTMESYKIVVFNRERDLQINRSFCLRKNYVLFKCRNCDVIIDKLREDIHKCDFTNVKQCPDCALLLNMKDYDSHMNTHKEFISFNYSNMKVILLGEANLLEMKSENVVNSKLKFKGAIYDYKIFVCNKCEICIRNEEVMPKHICRFGKQRSKCLKCGLYFSVGRLKTHKRWHEKDPDFLRPNMYIISFDPCTVDKNKNDTKLYSKDKDSEFSDSNTDSDSEILRANDTSTRDDANAVGLTREPIKEETAKLYKCTCELHFLNEGSISRHFGVCRSNPKMSKLKCQKCDLLFTPNVLFTHLLAHHNNNGRRYKYDIIEIDCDQGNMSQ